MNGEIGFSFAPGSNDLPMQGGMGRASVSAPASAVKVLSMRLPKRENPHALAPQALLQSPGSAGAPHGFDPNILSLLMRALAPGQATAGVPVMPSGGNTFSDGLRRERGLSGINDRQMPGFETDPLPLPPPRIMPGEDPTERTPIGEPAAPTLPENPWGMPGRNPKLAEKYGQEGPLGGMDLQSLF
jgi:hypothetical protein